MYIVVMQKNTPRRFLLGLFLSLCLLLDVRLGDNGDASSLIGSTELQAAFGATDAGTGFGYVGHESRDGAARQTGRSARTQAADGGLDERRRDARAREGRPRAVHGGSGGRASSAAAGGKEASAGAG